MEETIRCSGEMRTGIKLLGGSCGKTTKIPLAKMCKFTWWSVMEI